VWVKGIFIESRYVLFSLVRYVRTSIISHFPNFLPFFCNDKFESTTMRSLQSIVLLLLCCQATTGLVTPNRQLAKSPSVAPKTRLGNDATVAAAELPRSGEGTATIPNEVFNLIKSIVGAGVLSLPAGK
jgi:hypothetical protein